MKLVYDVCLKLGQQQLLLYTTALGASARIWNAAAIRAMKNTVELARHAPICAPDAASTNFDALAAAQKRYFDAVNSAIAWPGLEAPRAAKLKETDHKAPRASVAEKARDALAQV